MSFSQIDAWGQRPTNELFDNDHESEIDQFFSHANKDTDRETRIPVTFSLI